MIKQLKRKFILFTTGAVFALLLLVFAAVNIGNFAAVTASADEITLVLWKNNGAFPDITSSSSSSAASGAILYASDEVNPGTPPEGGIPGGRETRYDTRYFTVAFDAAGSVVKTDVSKITLSADEAVTIAKDILNGADTGYYGDYRFRKGKESNGNTLVVVMDYSRQLSPTKNLLYGTLIVLPVGTLITFLVAWAVSKRFVKPIEEATRKQKRFISDASHELKTPITIISANNDIIEMEYGQSDSTRTITKEVRKLDKMVKSLNSLAVLDEVGKIEKTDVDVSLLMNEVTESFLTAFSDRGKELVLEIEEGIHEKTNDAQLRKVFSIVMDNALKYTQKKATVRLFKENGRVVVEERNDVDAVINDGPHEEVFGRFYRAEDVRGEIEGSGIGLAIAREAMASIGGRIMANGVDGDFVLKIEI